LIYKVGFGREFTAYLWAVTATAVALAAAHLWADATLRWVSHGLPSLSLIVALFVTYWVLTFVCAGIPFIAAYWFARWFSIKSGFYYVMCGAFIGTLFVPALVYIGLFPVEQIFASVEPEYQWPFIDQCRVQCLSIVPWVALSGVFGALVFWWKAGRYQ